MEEAYLDGDGNLWIVSENRDGTAYLPISAAGWPRNDAEFLKAMHIEIYEELDGHDE